MSKRMAKSIRRLSLNNVFTFAFAALFLVFLAITGFSYLQLMSIKQALDATFKEAIPTIIVYDKIANNSARLAFYSEQLANATNPPALRLAQEKVSLETLHVATLLAESNADVVVLREFEAIQFELQELAALVQQRLDNITIVATIERNMYELFNQARQLKLHSDKPNQAAISAWFDGISQLTVQAGSLMSQNKLYQIRKNREDIEAVFESLTPMALDLSDDLASKTNALNNRFEQAILGEDGLIALKILQLRIEGQTTGRGNFTEKLVSDFARSINFKSATVNDDILLEAAEEQSQISFQIRILVFFFAISITLFVMITWILRRRVIKRLVLLNQKVSGVQSSATKLNDLRAEDEITDIAKTFEDFYYTIEQQKRELSRLAMQDGLTSIANRRAFDIELLRSFSLASRHNLAMSILLLDVDFFKAYNDFFGHTKGDEALIKIAKVMKNALRREIDFIARYGGEEFVCLLPGCNEEGALLVAENLRKAVFDLKIPHRKSEINDVVTISIGGAVADNFEQRTISPEALLEAADKALYAAKAEGRNRVNVTKFE